MIIERSEARRLGMKHYFTGKPCVRGHVCARGVAGYCLDCRALKMRKIRDAGGKGPTDPVTRIFTKAAAKARSRADDLKFAIELKALESGVQP
jgi:hypothetical protein